MRIGKGENGEFITVYDKKDGLPKASLDINIHTQDKNGNGQ